MSYNFLFQFHLNNKYYNHLNRFVLNWKNLLWSKANVNTLICKNLIWRFRSFYMTFILEVFSAGISPYGCGGRRIVHACKDFNQFLIRPNKSRCRFSCFWLNTYKVQTTQNVKKKHAGNISVGVCMCLWGESQYGFNLNFSCLNT